MKLFHENPIFETVKSKVIISLFETVRLSVSISPRNLYHSLKSIKENVFLRFVVPCFCHKSNFITSLQRATQYVIKLTVIVNLSLVCYVIECFQKHPTALDYVSYVSYFF